MSDPMELNPLNKTINASVRAVTEKDELKKLRRKNILLTLFIALLLFLGGGLLGRLFEPQMLALSQYLRETFGFWGLCGITFVGDWIISPVPPDLVLLVVAKSSLREHWWFYVTVVAIASTLAGHLGWYCGRFLADHPRLPASLKKWPLRQKESVQKYGFWAVILGAATPLPFSITCWSAGFLQMKWSTFALATLFRFPRIFLYYLAIHYSNILY